MTTNESWIISLRPVLAEIERYLAWADGAFGMHLARPNTAIARADKPDGDVPDNLPLVVTIQTRGRRAQFGRFVSDSWAVSGGSANELCLSAEDLRRPLQDVLTTVHHEALHYRNWQRGIKDCSKSGRHNKLFKTAAEDFGMIGPDKAGKRGWSEVTFEAASWRMIEDGFQPNKAVFDLARRIIPPKAKAPTKMKKWQCPECQTIVRCATELSAECTTCDQRFELAD